MVSGSTSPVHIEGSGHWLEAKFEPPLAPISADVHRVGTFVVDSNIGQVATGTYTQSVMEGEETVELRNVVQDWNPGLSPGRLALRAVRLRNRQHESWSFDSKRTLSGENYEQASSWST